MPKTLIGPRLRQLRREHRQTQAEMAAALGVSTAYVNLLENNQRSLSVQMLMALSDAYGVDWRDLIKDESATLLVDLRTAMQDPAFGSAPPYLPELRAAIAHAPVLVGHPLQLYHRARTALAQLMQLGPQRIPDRPHAPSPAPPIHTFFRDPDTFFPPL